jgi:hypothetical protein
LAREVEFPNLLTQAYLDLPYLIATPGIRDKYSHAMQLLEQHKTRFKLSPGRAFPVNVTDFVPAKKMVGTGGMPLGLFKGERIFTLTPTTGDSVEFRMSETFTGLLSPLIERSIPDMQPAFDEFASSLKSAPRTPNRLFVLTRSGRSSDPVPSSR